MQIQIVVLLAAVVCGQASLLANMNFETTNYDGNWYCQGPCTLVDRNQAFSGHHSVLVIGRYCFCYCVVLTK